MVNSKNRRHKAICNDCNGNGYISNKSRELIMQCETATRKEKSMWMSPKLLSLILMLILLQMMLSSCTRDLQPNPYTTILKHMMKDKKK